MSGVSTDKGHAGLYSFHSTVMKLHFSVVAEGVVCLQSLQVSVMWDEFRKSAS